MHVGEGSGDAFTVVACEGGNGNRTGSFAASEGVTGPGPDTFSECIDNPGHGRVIPKSDQEAAIVDRQDKVRRDMAKQFEEIMGTHCAILRVQGPHPGRICVLIWRRMSIQWGH